MARQKQRVLNKPYLIARPAGFPGVEIPLLSEEECRARGIEPGRFPPRETWTQAQRDAADRFMEIALPHVVYEAMAIILDEIQSHPDDQSLPDRAQEQLAARRGLVVLDSGKWKQRETGFMHFPKSWVKQILESFESGHLSILDFDESKPVRKAKRSGKGRRRGVP